MKMSKQIEQTNKIDQTKFKYVKKVYIIIIKIIGY
jgi:hypothetical protein